MMDLLLALWVVAAFLVLAGLVGLVLPGIPGAPVLFAGLLCAAWAERFRHVGWKTLLALALLALSTYGVDLLTTAAGARTFGASKRAILGAIVGGGIGLFFGIPGVLLGPFVGAAFGELTARRDVPAAARAGVGATLGLLLGAVAKLAIGVSMVGLFVAVRVVSAGERPAENQAWYEPTEPIRIVGPIHYVGTRELGAYLITTPAGHILLDGAMPGAAPQIEASIRKLGFEPEQIRILLITHAHADHVGTLAHFKRLTGASVAVMAADAPLLASGGNTDYLYASDPKLHFEPVTADRLLKDGDAVSLGGIELTARHTPGHTPGCTTWRTTVEEGGRSYAVVFPGSTSVNPGTRLVHDPSYPGIANDYRLALGVLESLEPDIFLPAHASFFDYAGKRARAATEGAQAFVDREGYRRRIAAQRATFEAQVTEEEQADGEPGT